MTDKTIIWTLDWVPDSPRGFVRDLRLRWAAEEAGLAYEVRTVPFDDRATNHLDRQPFGQVPFLSDGDITLFESGAWLAADRFTVADLLMADVLRVPAVRAHGKRPATEAYVERITARPAFRKAHADQLAHFAAADRLRKAQ